MEEGQVAPSSQQEVRDEAGRLPAPASHQGADSRGQWQLLLSSRRCRDHGDCFRERCLFTVLIFLQQNGKSKRFFDVNLNHFYSLS